MEMERERKLYNIEIIGFVLTVLYAISLLVFINYLIVPEFKSRMTAYVILFSLLCIGSLGVMTHKEWGRKSLVVLNCIILFCLAVRYIPQIDIVPLAYLFLSVIVILYFTQSRVKIQFHSGTYDPWNKSILVVDDDELIHKLVRPILLSHGYAVLAASSGEEGLQIARRQKPDLILLDVILPGLKGRDMCAKLKEDPQTKDIPVVFLTAKDSPEDIEAEKKVGSSGHLTKPVNAKILVETIQGILDPKKARKRP